MALLPGGAPPTQDPGMSPWNHVLSGIATAGAQPRPGATPTGAGPLPFGPRPNTPGATTASGVPVPSGNPLNFSPSSAPTNQGGPATAPRQPYTPQVATENPGQYPGGTVAPENPGMYPGGPAPLTPGGAGVTGTPMNQPGSLSSQTAAGGPVTPGALPAAGPLAGTTPTTTAPAAPATPAAGSGPAGAYGPTGAETGSLPSGPGSQLTAYGPDSSLIGSQINASANPSRSDIANQYFQEAQQASNPAYEAALRDATQRAAATGSLGSGMLNTSYGNLALQRSQDLDNLQKQLQTQATAGTIQDNQYNTGVAQQQQAYQAAQAQQALQNQIAQLQLENQIGGSQAGYLAGYNPWPGIAGSNVYGNQSSQSQSQLQQLMQAAGLGSSITNALGGAGDIGSYLSGLDPASVAANVGTNVTTAIPGAINDFANLLG